jgi:hypothetical protein
VNYIHPDLPTPEPIFREDRNGTRYYAHVDETGAVTWYPSVTTVIRDTSPTPYGLLAWYAKHGMQDANRLRDDAAEYGTSLHIDIARIMSGEVVTPDSERKAKDLMAWVAFCKERNVEPVAVEIPLVSRTLKIAGTCDLVCWLDFGKGRELAIIDIKSGGSYEDHAVQLDMYRIAFNEQYREALGQGVVFTFNWHPNDWQKAPTYKLVNQTAACKPDEASLRCQLWHAMHNASPRPYLTVSGPVGLGMEMPTITSENPDDTARAKWQALTGQTITDDAVVLLDDVEGAAV